LNYHRWEDSFGHQGTGAARDEPGRGQCPGGGGTPRRGLVRLVLQVPLGDAGCGTGCSNENNGEDNMGNSKLKNVKP